ncbi:hypothetical protein RRG08_038187 [Elysia crispata]|uniref:Uncharacterized protein n=1 Tax=Elysia crispata TaxID=231223 RepID=A0AAE1E215_9GAST|nr:hypothetical protein RRG08_038187 [Elysia crispata]
MTVAVTRYHRDCYVDDVHFASTTVAEGVMYPKQLYRIHTLLTLTLDISYCNTAVISYCDTAVVSYCDTAVVSYCDTAVVSYCDTAVVSYCDTAVISYCDTAVVSYYDTAVISYCNTAVISYCNTAVMLTGVHRCFAHNVTKDLIGHARPIVSMVSG